VIVKHKSNLHLLRKTIDDIEVIYENKSYDAAISLLEFLTANTDVLINLIKAEKEYESLSNMQEQS